jgi:hypothetical protein
MGAVQVMKLLITQFPPGPVTSSLLRTNTLLSTLLSRTLYIIPLLWDSKFRSHIEQHAKLHELRVTPYSSIYPYSSHTLQSVRTLAAKKSSSIPSNLWPTHDNLWPTHDNFLFSRLQVLFNLISPAFRCSSSFPFLFQSGCHYFSGTLSLLIPSMCPQNLNLSDFINSYNVFPF